MFGDELDRVDGDLLRAVLRTVRLLDTPQDIPVLAPLPLRELVYRLATADRGHRLRWPSTDSAGPGARIARAVGDCDLCGWRLVCNIADPIPGANFRTDSFASLATDPRAGSTP
ncbi:MAG: bacterial regulatory helix-turn-helix, AraC family protein, partial [Actinomycetia bacterium]|nr:bacterial regulatory helix-turn-helix, AraC family protein [Actinomycetes bacterium]